MVSTQGDFSFDEHTWKTISSSAKQLISSLLNVDPHRRPLHMRSVGYRPLISETSSLPFKWNLDLSSAIASNHAAIASVLSSTVFLRTKKLRTLLGFHDLTNEELEKLRKHFKRICANGDNATLSEFEQVLKAMNMSSLLPLAPHVFDLFDNNHDRTGFTGLILVNLRNSHRDDALQLCFQMYDTDRSGCITKGEVASMLRVNISPPSFEACRVSRNAKAVQRCKICPLI
ncbi:calcium and calcium/calmodulin-dependent serine/threonine-protein kinase-like [Magnolia sinica]|uniref:calcium and calcium/calmodulin-dependent serine/threonine-protein kinase-like n=1 Tax=Magnolia sinica TaxID=86752 RepID=UPI00265AC168|nr:calcium and calcium/calmodulin-dependent serine/threonine-protein kinase-like [Magnolia sinica]